MAEYIEREAVLDVLNNNIVLFESWPHLLNGKECLARAVKNAPAADVAPVVHGEWKLPTINGKPLLITNFTCSVCGEFSHEETNYCPNCGARMDGGSR